MPTIQAWDICAIALHTGERWHYHVDGRGLSGGGGAKPEVAQGSTPIYLHPLLVPKASSLRYLAQL